MFNVTGAMSKRISGVNAYCISLQVSRHRDLTGHCRTRDVDAQDRHQLFA